MITSKLCCTDCIKSDVCQFKDETKFAFRELMQTNTSINPESHLAAKDNQRLKISVECTLYVPKSSYTSLFRGEKS